MSRKKNVLTLINEAANSTDHQIVALPLVCGTGKSTAITGKIAEAIRKQEGLIVITDRVYRFNIYLNSAYDQESSKYIEKHLEEVSIL